MRTTLLRSVIAAVCVGALPSRLEAQTTAVWTHTAQRKIQHFEMTPLGDVFIGTDRRTYVLDGASGDTVWARDDIRDCGHKLRSGLTTVGFVLECSYQGTAKSVLDILEGTPFATIRPKDKFAVLELRSGQMLFDSDSAKLGRIGVADYLTDSRSFLMHSDPGGNQQDVIAAVVRDSIHIWRTGLSIKTDARWFPLLDGRRAMVYGKDGRRRVVAVLDLDERRVVWSKTDILESDMPKGFVPFPLADLSGGWIIYFGRPGPIRVDSAGNVAWRSEALPRQDPVSLTALDGALVARIKNEIIGLNPGNGAQLWRTKVRNAPATLVIGSPSGALVLSTSAVDLLASDDGSPRWSNPVSMPLGSTFTFDREHFYVASKDRTVTIRLQDGSTLSSDPYQWQHGEVPTSAVVVEDGLLLGSSHNLAFVEQSGRVRFQRSFAPVKESGVLVALRAPMAIALGAATAAHNLANTPGTANPLTASPQLPGPALSRDFFGKYANINTVIGDFAFIHTSGPVADTSGYSIVRLNRKTGEEAGRVWLGAKNPNLYSGPPDNSRPAWEGVRKTNYYLHWGTHTVFVRDANRTVTAFRFPPVG